MPQRQSRIRWNIPTAATASLAADDALRSGGEDATTELLGVLAVLGEPTADTPLSPHDETIFLLHTAAEIEHALLVQYLYAAYSLDTRDIPRGSNPPANAATTTREWQRAILHTAHEEMGHLITLQNILRVLGGALNLEREDMPFRSAFYPFPFRLEPLTKNSLAKYILAEMPDSPDPAVLSPDEVAEIKSRVKALHPEEEGPLVNRVGALYAKLIALVQRLPHELFRGDVEPFQANTTEWHGNDVALGRDPQTRRITTVGPGVLVMPTRSKDEVLDALTAIAIQGEAMTAHSTPLNSSHFERFVSIYKHPDFPDITDLEDNTVPWQPARTMPVDPSTGDSTLSDPQLEQARITNRKALAWSLMVNLRYRRLLHCIQHSLYLSRDTAVGGGTEAESRALLVKWAFEEMVIFLRTYCRLVAEMPRKQEPEAAQPDREPLVAGPPFALPYTLNLPDREPDRWRLHRNLLQTSANIIRQIEEEGPSAEEANLLEQLRQSEQEYRREIARRTGDPDPFPEFITDIQELRLLPPLAIARFGSSPDPMDNYEVEYGIPRPGSEPTFRTLTGAETLVVDAGTGAITGVRIPDTVRFRDEAGRIRPISPFFEVWGRFEEGGTLQPLTERHLLALGIGKESLQWRVRAANHKAFRRTGKAEDQINADTKAFNDHESHVLEGSAVNFKSGKVIPLGTVRFLVPTEAFPEFRLRFTPTAGRVYGPVKDANTVDDVYDAGKGTWDGHRDGAPGTPPFTNPAGIYATDSTAPPVPGQGPASIGYLDDACDGIVEVGLTLGGKTLTAFARFTAGPPDFAPQCLPVRSVADDVEQMLLGPNAPAEITPEEVTEILRRAFDTILMMNTEAMNRRGMSQHDSRLGRASEPIFQPEARAKNVAVRGFHAIRLQELQGLTAPAGTQQRNAAVAALGRMVTLLRTFENVGDLTDPARRLMPPMMRGADGLHLALTRRQIDLVRQAHERFGAPPEPGSTPEEEMVRLIERFRTFQFLHIGIPVGDGRTLNQLFDDPPALMNYLRTATAKGGAAGGALGKALIVPGDPDASAFFQLISRPDHPMNSRFSEADPVTNRTGIDIVRNWILSLNDGGN